VYGRERLIFDSLVLKFAHDWIRPPSPSGYGAMKSEADFKMRKVSEN
jgi:hypothetical protein